MPLQCASCQTDLPPEKEPTALENAFGVRKSSLCPKCREIQNLKLRKFRCLAQLFITPPLFIIAWITRPVDNVFWIYVNLCLLYWCLELSTVFHELGHAFLGKWTGWKINKIVLGKGPELAKFKFMGFHWELRRWFGGGTTYATYVGFNTGDSPYLWFTAGGILFNLLLAVITGSWLAWKIISPTDAVLTGFAPSEMFLAANMIIILSVLWPQKITRDGKKLESDGLRLFKSVTKTDPNANSRRSLAKIRLATTEEQAGNLIKAREIISNALIKDPNNKFLLGIQDAFALDAGEFETALAGFLAFSKRHDLTDHERAIACNNLAYLYAVEGNPEKLAEADELSQSAIAVLPNEAFAKGTRASVLIRLGRHSEGEKMIIDLKPEVTKISHQVQHSCWLALAVARQGRHDEARRHLAEAREKIPGFYLITRFEKIITTLENPSASDP